MFPVHVVPEVANVHSTDQVVGGAHRRPRLRSHGFEGAPLRYPTQVDIANAMEPVGLNERV